MSACQSIIASVRHKCGMQDPQMHLQALNSLKTADFVLEDVEPLCEYIFRVISDRSCSDPDVIFELCQLAM